MRWLAAAAFFVLSACGLATAAPALSMLHVKGAGSCPEQPVSLQSVEAEFFVIALKANPDGFGTPHEAALAFYRFHEAAYQGTDPATELAGFLLRSDDGRYYFTNAVEVPLAFRLAARVARPRGWTVGSLLHTHPGGRDCQETFSIEDRETVLRGAAPGNYVRTPLGNARFINRHLAERTAMRAGADGLSVCPGGAPCLAPHHDRAYASR